ncbi:MAG: 3-dehydroquinate synthase [Clostridia bacterium]|nr:3-dehydroquinate synthase [Clostridia bacterium]
MILPVHLSEKSYDIVLASGALGKAGELFDLNRKVLVVTDSGAPTEYAEAIVRQCAEPTLAVLDAGEESKNIGNFEKLLGMMLKKGFTRRDAVVAVGGGVVGDLSGFVAASFMRGIDFYNVPTTLLSQLDSSVGGKTAIDLCGVKNCVGAFWQPKKVLIDPDVLQTLDDRQFRSGMAEAVKMAATSSKELFTLFENSEPDGFRKDIEQIIASALQIKISVVEADETETGLRRILNFGHTVGHAVESASGMALTHGESVAIGMLPMAGDGVRQRIEAVLKKLGLPTECGIPAEDLISFLLHDKKKAGNKIYTVYVNEIGNGEIVQEEMTDVANKTIERMKK